MNPYKIGMVGLMSVFAASCQDPDYAPEANLTAFSYLDPSHEMTLQEAGVSAFDLSCVAVGNLANSPETIAMVNFYKDRIDKTYNRTMPASRLSEEQKIATDQLSAADSRVSERIYVNCRQVYANSLK